MNWFNNQNLRTKVITLLGFPLLLLLSISVLVLIESSRLQDDIDYLVEKSLNRYINYNELFTQGLQVGQATKNYVFDTSDNEALKNYENGLKIFQKLIVQEKN